MRPFVLHRLPDPSYVCEGSVVKHSGGILDKPVNNLVEAAYSYKGRKAGGRNGGAGQDDESLCLKTCLKAPKMHAAIKGRRARSPALNLLTLRLFGFDLCNSAASPLLKAI